MSSIDPRLEETPGGGLGVIFRPGKKPAHSEFPKMADESTRRPEPLTQSKALGWIIGINSTLVITGVISIVSVLWNLNSALIKVTANQDNLTNQLATMQTNLTTSTANRYTSADAATDRAAILQTLNSTRDAWSLSFKSIIDANTEQSKQIDDLRQKVTRLEAHNSKP